MRTSKRGDLRSRLDTEAIFGAGFGTAEYSAHCVSESLVAGTGGPLTAEVVYVDAKDEADLQRFKGKLKGAIVLTGKMREVKARFEPLGTRLNEKDLLNLPMRPSRGPVARRRRNARATSGAGFQSPGSINFFRTKARRCWLTPVASEMAARSSCSRQPCRSRSATMSFGARRAAPDSGVRQDGAEDIAAAGARRRTLQSHRAHDRSR